MGRTASGISPPLAYPFPSDTDYFYESDRSPQEWGSGRNVGVGGRLDGRHDEFRIRGTGTSRGTAAAARPPPVDSGSRRRNEIDTIVEAWLYPDYPTLLDGLGDSRTASARNRADGGHPGSVRVRHSRTTRCSDGNRREDAASGLGRPASWEVRVVTASGAYPANGASATAARPPGSSAGRMPRPSKRHCG